MVLLAVIAVTGVAFVASLPALLGAASAVGLPPLAAWAYALVPDAATVIALFALLVLRSDPAARRVAITSLTVFALISAVLNASAAIGTTPHGLVAQRMDTPLALALIIAVTPVLGVVLGADLAARSLAALYPAVELAALPPVPRPRRTVTPELEPEDFLERCRVYALDRGRKGLPVSRATLKADLGLGTNRAAEAMRALRAEGLIIDKEAA